MQVITGILVICNNYKSDPCIASLLNNLFVKQQQQQQTKNVGGHLKAGATSSVNTYDKHVYCPMFRPTITSSY